MARQYSTFSVVNILGQGTAEDRVVTSGEAKTKDPSTSVSYKRGTVRQMLPPLPRVFCSTDASDQPFLYPQSDLLTQHLSPPPLEEESSDTTSTDKQTPCKRRRKGKRGAKRSRVSSEAGDSPLPAGEEEGEDDVFAQRSAARAAPALLSTRDLTSSGATPSPPGGTPAGTNRSTGPGIVAKTASDQQEELGKFSEPTLATFIHSSLSLSLSLSLSVYSEEEEEEPKKKRARTAYTREQLHTMERHFRKNAYPDCHLLRLISNEAGIASPKIQVSSMESFTYSLSV